MLFAEGSEFVDMGEYLLDGGVVWCGRLSAWLMITIEMSCYFMCVNYNKQATFIY